LTALDSCTVLFLLGLISLARANDVDDKPVDTAITEAAAKEVRV